MDKNSHGWFRLLVLGIVISMVYDVVWFLLRTGDMSAEDDGDKGMEKMIRRFSLFMAIISIIIKFIMCFVYWMTSLKFVDLLDERARLI